jgi:hypothetical protein
MRAFFLKRAAICRERDLMKVKHAAHFQFFLFKMPFIS